ncbi:hypothetical protein Tco_0738300 [Tanacetum coccineum]
MSLFPHRGKEPVINHHPSLDITKALDSVRSQASISLPPGAKVERLLPMTTPSPSPPISLSPPSAGERLARCMALPAHSSPPPVPSPLLPSPRIVVWMVEEEAYASQEAWAPSIELSQATHQELQTYRDHVYAHETHIQAHQTQLQLLGTLIQTHHQAQMVETLCVMRDIRREMGDMQAKLLALREAMRRRARQPPPDARIPDHQDASGDADSHV